MSNEALRLIDLTDWFSEYVETKQTAPDEIVLEVCPECFDDRFKLYVNTDKLCWVCQHCKYGRGLGDMCHLMAKVSDRHINDIRKELATYVVPTVTKDKFASYIESQLDPTTVEEELNLGPEKIDLPGIRDFSGPFGLQALKYALSRGLTQEDLESYELRVSNKVQNVIGPFLVFPVHYKGLPVAFQGRRVTQREPRYMSSDAIAQWLWPLDRLTSDTVYLAEGVFDAIGCHKAGFPALCTFGNKITYRQIELLKKYKVKNVVLTWDPTAYREIDMYSKSLRTCFNTSLVDFSEFLGKGRKIDPGDALTDKTVLTQLSDFLENKVINAYGSGYLEWYTKSQFA